MMEEMLSKLKNSTQMKRVLVTGGCGFIGSHVVDLLMASGKTVTVFDNLSSGNIKWISPYLESSNFRFIQADLCDEEAVTTSVVGQDLIWHLGANGDIPGGSRNTKLDLENSIIGTRNVLEAMKRVGVRNLLFASTGAVYGDTQEVPTPETAGPLLPVSLYGASKIAAETYISAYCHLFGLNGWIFRFGNVVGGRMCRGAIHDFICKLMRNPLELEVLGDGNQEKNYFLVEECIEGMLHAYHQVPLTDDRPCVILNLGANESTGLSTIIYEVCNAMDLLGVRVCYTGSKRGWPGDQPRVMLEVSNVQSFGWHARRTSNEAIRTAAQRMVAYLRDDKDMRLFSSKEV